MNYTRKNPLDWETARFERFLELWSRCGPDHDHVTSRSGEHAGVATMMNCPPLGEALAQLEAELPVPEPLPAEPRRSTVGRPRKNCGHSESERKTRSCGSTYCAACKREWAARHRKQRVAA